MNAGLQILVESSVRAIVIAFAVALVLRCLRIKSPAICHRAWTGVLLIMLFLPAFSLWVPRIKLPWLPPVVQVQIPKPGSAVPMIPHMRADIPDASRVSRSLPLVTIKKTPDYKVEVLRGLGIFYAVGFFVLAVRLLAGMWLSNRMSRNASLDEKGFYCCPCSVPMTVGLMRTRIILPLDWVNWDTAKLDAALTHENAHMRRRDPMVEWVALLNRCLYWFHPLAWWLCRKLSGLAEQACDEAVLARGHDGGEYARHLIDFAQAVKQKGALVTAWGSSLYGSTLAVRIRRMVTIGRSPAISKIRLTALFILCTAAVVLPSLCELVRAQGEPLPVPSKADPGFNITVKSNATIPVPLFSLSTPLSNTAPHSAIAAQPQSNQPNSSNAPDKDLYEAGLRLAETSQFQRARLAFQSMINTYPDSRYTAAAYFAIGDSFYNEGGTGNLLQAEDQFRNFVMFFAQDAKAPDAQMRLISIGMQMIRQYPDDSKKVERSKQQFLEQFPNSDYVPIVRQYLKEIQEMKSKRGAPGTRSSIDPIVGIWKLDVAKSQLPPMKTGPQYFQAQTAVYQALDDGQIKYTITGAMPDGSPIPSITWLWPRQGGIAKVQPPLPPGMSYVETRIGPGDWYLMGLQNGKQIDLTHFVVSQDGETLRIATESTDAPNQTYEFILERQ